MTDPRHENWRPLADVIEHGWQAPIELPVRWCHTHQSVSHAPTDEDGWCEASFMTDLELTEHPCPLTPCFTRHPNTERTPT